MAVVIAVNPSQILKLVAEGGMGVCDIGAIITAFWVSKHYFDRQVHKDSYHYLLTKTLRNKAMEEDRAIYRKIGQDFANKAKILLILSPILVAIVCIFVQY